MPFFLKPCFKLRKKNNKKKSKKRDQHVKIFSDITAPATMEDIIQQCETVAGSSISNEDDDVSHPDVNNICISTITQSARTVLNENEHDDSCQDVLPQNSIYDKQEDISTATHLNNSETDDVALHCILSESDKDSDSKVSITVQNINKFLEANQDIAEFSTTVKEVLKVSELRDIAEEICFQKSYEIISNITVKSNVCQAVEKLEAIENVLNRLHENVMQAEAENHIKNIDIGNTKHDAFDSHKLVHDIHSEKSDMILVHDIETPADCNDSVTPSGKENVSSSKMDIVAVGELESDIRDFQKTFKIDSKISLENAGRNQKAGGDSLLKSGESIESVTLATEDTNVCCDSECDIYDLKHHSKRESNNLLENFAAKSAQDVYDTNIPDMIYENEASYIPVNKISINACSDIYKDKIGKKTNTNIELLTSDENIERNDDIIHSKMNESATKINDGFEIVNGEHSNNEFKDTHDTKIDSVPLQLDSNTNGCHNITEGTKMSTENTNFSAENLQLEYKINISEEKINCNYESNVGTHEIEIILSDLLKKKEGFNHCQSIEILKAELIPSSDDNILIEIAKPSEDNILAHHTETHHTLSNISHVIMKSDEVIFDNMSNSLPKMIKCDMNSTSESTFSSPVTTEKLDSQNGSSLNNSLEIIANDDPFHTNSNEDAPNIGLNFKSNETFICCKSNEYLELSSGKKQQEYKLQTSEQVTHFKKDNSNNLEKNKIDHNLVNIAYDSNAEEVIHDPHVKVFSNIENCWFNSCSESSEYIAFSGNKDNENSGKILDNLQNKDDMLKIGDNAEIGVIEEIGNKGDIGEIVNIGDSICENKFLFHQTPDSVNDIKLIDNTSSYEHYLNDGSYPKTDSNTFNETSESIKVEQSNFILKLEKSDSTSEIENSLLQEEKEGTLNRSSGIVFENAEYCKDVMEDSEDDKYQGENIYIFQQSEDGFAEYSREDSTVSQIKQSNVLGFDENCQQMGNFPNNQMNKLSTPTVFNGCSRYAAKKKEIGKYVEPLQNMQYDGNYSSESSIFSESEGMWQKMKATGTGNFLIFGKGDSETEEKFPDESHTLRILQKTSQTPQYNSELKQIYPKGKKVLPKIRRRRNIKICINKKRLPTINGKTEKTSGIHGNNKCTFHTGKNGNFQSVDPLRLLSNFKQNRLDPQITRTIKSKKIKIPRDVRTSTDINDKDKIEIRRKENINLFKKRKLDIFSQMGPNLRAIPVKKVDILEIKACKIEKFGLNTELNHLIKKGPVNEHLHSRWDKYEISDMHEKSLLLKNNATKQNHPASGGFLCESDSEPLNESLEAMTPIRKKILDSSRSIRSPKYPLTLRAKLSENKGMHPIQPLFQKSTKRNVVAVLADDKKFTYKFKDGQKSYSPYFEKFETVRPKKLTGDAEDTSRQHTQNYRATSPDDLKSKFDDVFKKYAGRGRINGDLISYKRSTEWLRDAGILGEALTAEEATDAFKCAAGVKVALNKGDYRHFLKKLTRVKKLNYNEVYEKLCEASRRFVEA